jgi:hypothetical protein
MNFFSSAPKLLIRRNYLLIFIFIILFYYCPLGTRGQSVPFKSKLWIESKVHYGFVMPHHGSMIHLTPQHFTMFELDVLQATDGSQLWEQLHKYPLTGISLLYTDLGGAKYLGKAVGIFPYLDFQLTKGKRINLFFRFGTGLGYLTKPFNRFENYKNIAMGSHFNALIHLMYELRWKPVPRLDITTGISLTHFSNGAIKTPNLGINVPAVNLGIAWKMDKVQPERIRQELPSFNKRKWEFNVIGMFGISELYAAGGPKYTAYIVSASFLKPLSMKRKIGIGVDIFYDNAVVESLHRVKVEVGNKLEVIRPGLSFTYKLEFSKLAIVMQAGAYVYSKYKGDGYIYDRFALQYRFGDHILIHLAMKTHLFRADMIEYGIGYKF